MKYKNPIIPGFYPDPSICRVGKDFYLVTSSFEYFPGVPVFHSVDLLNWKQIGHCLTRASQLPLEKAPSSGGIYAPTIRYNSGTFYMVTTNTTYGGNFYVHTENPAGEWSEPIFVDQSGIDPSLFFDDDGKTYFCSNGENGIYLCEIDVSTGKKITATKHIWTGTGGRYPEAPHLYKIKGKYYLMIAEGGTEYGHMETIARSDNPFGPFNSCPYNPILTHRNRGAHEIQGTGHADLIEDEKGNWWLVFLAFRPELNYWHHIGRETFLAPVEWSEDGWPIINETGTVEIEMDSNKLCSPQCLEGALKYNFNSSELEYCWNFLRNPHKGDWSLTEREGFLRLNGSKVTLNEEDSPAFIGRRQQHKKCKVQTLLEFEPTEEGEEAGLTVLMNERHHYEIALINKEGKRKLIVRKTIGSLSVVTAEELIEDGDIVLAVTADNLEYTFSYAQGSNDLKDICKGETRYVSTEVAGGFTGVYFGMYATGNGKQSTTPAYFDWFEYNSGY